MSDSKAWLDEDPEDGRELSATQEEKYQNYLEKEDPSEGVHKDRRSWLRKNLSFRYATQYGDDYRDGLAITRGWTEDNGWEIEQRVSAGASDRYYDAGNRRKPPVGREIKYGEVGRDRTLGVQGQLAKDERAVKLGRRVNWHVSDLSKVDKKVLAKLHELENKYPGRFAVEQVSAAETELALAIGKEMREHRAGNGKPLPSYYAAQRELAKRHADSIAKLGGRNLDAANRHAMDGGKSLAAEVKARTKALKGKESALKESIKALRDHATAHAKMVGGWAKVPKGLTNLTKAMKNSSTAQKNVQGATKSWIGAHGKINASMMKSPLGMIALGITALIGVVTLIIGNWGTIEKVFEAVRKNTLEPVGAFFQNVLASATAGLSNVTKGISDSFSGLGSGVEGVFKTVIHHVAIVVNAIGSVLKRLNIPLPDWLGGGSIGYGFIGDAMVEWAAAHMATGGVVRGPGGPRDDQVPIMASNGEFVVNAASASRHIALLEAINSDSLTISGRDAQVIAVMRDAFTVPSRALPHVVNRHHFDHSTTVNLTTNHIDSAHVRAKTLATQREVAASWA
ncbi:hypothetical protein ACIO14_18020 [Nocardia fluminea]|uniref:hypothetical protein n=1 Tax=Nocardia fluminea TaxID=134984 RepID=UPI0037F17609